MGYVPKAPAKTRSYDTDRREIKADLDRLGRQRIDPRPQVQLVKVEPEKSEHWPPGTAWLDTSGE